MFTFNAEARKEQGKGASRRLRAANKLLMVKKKKLKLRLYSVTRSSQSWLTSTSFALNRKPVNVTEERLLTEPFFFTLSPPPVQPSPSLLPKSPRCSRYLQA